MIFFKTISQEYYKVCVCAVPGNSKQKFRIFRNEINDLGAETLV